MDKFFKWTWEACTDDISNSRTYTLDEASTRIATNTGGNWCTVTGNTPIPLNKVISWSIKILNSGEGDGDGIYVGVAPAGIDQDGGLWNMENSGWYFDCWESKLTSGAPHNYRDKEYGPRRGEGEYVKTGDTIDVVMDMTRGDLSFALRGKNLGVAYDGIPLDRPLVPCVILADSGNSVELVASEGRSAGVPTPSNVAGKSGATWDSIVLTWNAVKGASQYQIEVDGGKVLGISTAARYYKRGFCADSEHAFRVRAVRGNEMSEWSSAVVARTERATFETSGWKDCPEDIDAIRKYSVNQKNSRVTVKEGNGNLWCTVIGNMPLPPNSLASWKVKVVKSRKNNCGYICVGVAPADVDQSDNSHEKCGWYLDCWKSALYSGPPHCYSDVEYGPRKGDGKYMRAGDSVGVEVDTGMGEIAFQVKNMNLGVAYEGVPLDRPLVPCVLIGFKGDSVELVAPEAREIESKEVPVPAAITVRSGTQDSITLSWDPVKGASFYQIEVDGNEILGSATENVFTQSGLSTGSEHEFRVRVIRRFQVGEWSTVVKGRTQKLSRYGGFWAECPDGADESRTYSVVGEDRLVATKTGAGYDCCTVVGNTPLPFKMMTSWSIRVLKSRDSDGGDMYVGVAPIDIVRNEDNYERCGWYFDCFSSELRSGPPHNYRGEDYGPRKAYGEYVHDGDIVGVVMNTMSNELSFTLNEEDLGVAYGGIPLDKPLLPCVIITYKDDSVELII